jgi:hypothetical protein
VLNTLRAAPSKRITAETGITRAVDHKAYGKTFRSEYSVNLGDEVYGIAEGKNYYGKLGSQRVGSERVDLRRQGGWDGIVDSLRAETDTRFTKATGIVTRSVTRNGTRSFGKGPGKG